MRKDQERTELEELIAAFKKEVTDVRARHDDLDQCFKQEQSTNSALRRQLVFFESQQRALEQEKNEFRQAKKQLQMCKEIGVLLSGN